MCSAIVTVVGVSMNVQYWLLFIGVFGLMSVCVGLCAVRYGKRWHHWVHQKKMHLEQLDQKEGANKNKSPRVKG